MLNSIAKTCTDSSVRIEIFDQAPQVFADRVHRQDEPEPAGGQV